MPWPTNTDYQEAIQNPMLCFADLELKTGTVETNRLGLPFPRSGNFASVYKIRCISRTVAVRCFLREIADRRQRYQEISRHLQTANLPWMGGFDFVQQGICVRGQWYPILKMEWFDGALLLEYVRQNLRTPSKCFQLSKQWLALCKDLQATGIAHGDFQHGNIMVINDQLKLIDYDGVYVPSLANSISHEVGHPNYQHPYRAPKHFGPYLDNFSAWVVYLSLVAFSLDPSLWTTLNAGDECLLFRKEDFDSPETSRAFATLEQHSNLQIQTLATVFRNLLYLEPEQIPSLDGQVVTSGEPKHKPAAWIDDYVRNTGDGKELPASPQESGIPVEGATWVLDFVDHAKQPAEEVDFPASLFQLRLLAFASLFGIAALAIPTSVAKDVDNQLGWLVLLGLLLGFLVPVNIITMRSKYENDPLVLARNKALAALSAERSKSVALRQALTDLQKQRQTLLKEEDLRLAAIQSRADETRMLENQDINNLQSGLTSAMTDISRRRHQVQTELDSAINSIRTRCGNEINRLARELSMLPQIEATELSNALVSLQRQYIDEYLRQCRIPDAGIRGIGPGLAHDLRVAGFLTAADIDYHAVQNVAGVGQTRAQALHDWRERLENSVKARVPQKLPTATQAAISARFLQKRPQLQKDKSHWEAQLQQESNRILTEANNKFHTIEREQVATQTTVNHQSAALKRQYADKLATIADERGSVSRSYTAKRSELEENLRYRAQEVCQQNWQVAKVARQVERYRSISVLTLLKRVLFLR